MTRYIQIDLTESEEDEGLAAFDRQKLIAHNLDNTKVLDTLLKVLRPLAGAMSALVRPGTGVAVIHSVEKDDMEIVAVKQGMDEEADDTAQTAALTEALAALTVAEDYFAKVTPQVSWGDSAINAEGFALMNEAPSAVRRALALLKTLPIGEIDLGDLHKS